MLASPAADVAEAIADVGPASVEWKLDGARVQAHRAGGDVRLFTRNLNEVTDRLGGVVEVVSNLPGGDLVLDGEVLGRRRRRRARGGSRTRWATSGPMPAATHGGSGLQAFFFDVLHAGESVIDLPLVERRESAGRHRSRRQPAPVDRDGRRRRGAAIPRCGDRRRSRRRDGQGDRLPVRGRAAGRSLAEGQAGVHVRPRRDRSRVGSRPSPGMAVEPASRRTGRRRRVRDGRQDVQGVDRRAAALADRALPRAGDRAW